MGNILATMLSHDELRAAEELFRSLGFVRFCAFIRALAEYLARIVSEPYHLLRSSLHPNFNIAELGAVFLPLRDSSSLARSDSIAPRRARTHSSAFPEEPSERALKKRAISPAPVDEPCLELTLGNEDPSGDLVAIPSSLFDLPYDVLHLIYHRFRALPSDEWNALMYSSKLSHSMLSGPLLRDVGFLRSLEPGVLTVRPTLELKTHDAYKALIHWRMSQFFTDVDVLEIKLSKEDEVRNSELSYLSAFFAALPLEGTHFRVVHLFLSDYECGVELSALSRAMKLLHRTGCADFWINSSFLHEPGRLDPTSSLELVDYPAEGHSHRLERLAIHSPTILSPTIIPWFTRALESGSSLTTLDVLSVGLHPLQWDVILSRVNLSRLQYLRLVGVDARTLTKFLRRHPSVCSVQLDGFQEDSDDHALDGTLVLPALRNVEGTEVQVARFLRLLEPTPTFQFVNIIFREDSSRDARTREFDSGACINALRLLANLRARRNAYIMLSFNFSNVTSLSTSSLLNPPSTSSRTRPEWVLSIERLAINISGKPSGETIELLDKCLSWTSLFAHIKSLKIWVAEGVLTSELRNKYVLAFSDALRGAIISLSP